MMTNYSFLWISYSHVFVINSLLNYQYSVFSLDDNN